MFTGIIETVGTIASVTAVGPGLRMEIRSDIPTDQLKLGDSVAVDGACLTVTTKGGDRFSVDASRESVARTTLAGAKAGRQVHLERALRMGDRLDGHIVTGHVDARGRLVSRTREGAAWALRFSCPESLAPQLVEKGSVAVDGVSLTVNGAGPGWFVVTVIPFTSGHTTLVDKTVGDEVNLETDILGKYVAHLLGGRAASNAGSGGTSESADGSLMAALRRGGFA